MRRAPGGGKERVLARSTAWARKRPRRIAGHNPWKVAVEVGDAVRRHRVTGIAAEMSFFALLALVPLTLSFGAALGYLERIVGPTGITEGRDAVIVVLTTLIGPELTAETVAPFVRNLLTQERGGLALGSLLIAFWLGSRMFVPALRAVDGTHGGTEHASALRYRLVGLAMAAGSLLASVLTLAIMIVGPLLGGGHRLAAQLGLGGVYETLWRAGRWPALLLLLSGFLACFYRFAPSARTRWKDCLPGTVTGMGLWVLAASGFRLYLAMGGRPGAGVSGGEEVLVTVGRAVAAVIATMLWAFVSSLAILVGGEVNAALMRRGPEEEGRDRHAA